MHPNSPRLLDSPQELGASSCTFEAKQYSAYRFRLPPTPGMRLVQFKHDQQGQTTVRSSIDSDGAKTPRNPVLLPCLYIIIIPRPVSYFHVNFNNSGIVYKYITYISRVTGNYSTSKYPISRECKKSLDFYRQVLSIAFLSSYTC